MCVPWPHSLCRLLFSSLSASSSWMKGMPSMRRNTDSLGLRSPSERQPAGTQGRHGSRAARCCALEQDTAGRQPRQQVPVPGDPRGHERVAMRNYTPARLHPCAFAGTEQRPQVCVCANAHVPQSTCNCVSAVACLSCQWVPARPSRGTCGVGFW